MGTQRRSVATPQKEQPQQQETDLAFHLKYRPNILKEVVGQDAVIKSLQPLLLKKTHPHSFLFTGPSGTGKTTLARILASEFGCAPANIIETDAATNTGIDAMREITSTLRYQGFGNLPNKMIILDECFAPGTLVNTPVGLMPIELLKEGDLIIGAKGAAPIKKVKKSLVPIPRIIQLNLADGTSILVSEDHPFLTNVGWLRAKELTNVKPIWKINTTIPPQLQDLWDSIHEQWRGCSLLQEVLRQEVSEMWSNLLFQCEALLQGVREHCCSNETFLPETAGVASILEGSSSSHAFRESGILETASTKSFRKNDSDKPNVNSRSASESTSDEKATEQSTYLERKARGEWYRANSRASIITLLGWWCSGICNMYWKKSRSKWLAFKLQSRYWFPSITPSSGSRWPGPSFEENKGQGSIKGGAFEVVGVVRPTSLQLFNLELPKSSSTQSKGFAEFYDLEIDGHPSYGVHGLIAHNCHALTKAAWQSLLKAVEEPPAHVYFAFCTTDPGKVPETIRTRCSSYDLKPVRYDDLMDLLEGVAEKESIDVPTSYITQVARACHGSPRQALVMLATIADCESEEEVARLLEMPLENNEIIDLCRMMIKGDLSWSQVQKTIKALEDPNPESVRIVMTNYLNACLMGAKSEKDVPRLLDMLASFSKPCNPTDKMAPILLAIGNHMFPV